MEKIAISLNDLQAAVDKMIHAKSHNMLGEVIITIESTPSGNRYIRLEQPCAYADCNSDFHRILSI